jgi:hypothetical protein
MGRGAVLLGVLIVAGLGGCSRRGASLPVLSRDRDFILEDPIVIAVPYWQGEEGADEKHLTVEEFLREARVEAEARGWSGPLHGVFCLQGVPGEQGVTVDVYPLTEERIFRAGIDMRKVVHVVLHRRKAP